MLNASKALLKYTGTSFRDKHGVHGNCETGRKLLSKEIVNFHQEGILAALCQYFVESTSDAKYSLKDVLYNIPYIHRAYTLTYRSSKELFIPIKNARFVRKINSKEAWLICEVEWRYVNRYLKDKLPKGWELDTEAKNTIRVKKRFNWNSKSPTSNTNINNFKKYHTNIRKNVSYIYGFSRLWYLKRSQTSTGYIERSPLTLSFAIMHRLSELSRYDPDGLSKHLECQQNWLLSEFIKKALVQFIDEIACEITGSDFMLPGIRS